MLSLFALLAGALPVCAPAAARAQTYNLVYSFKGGATDGAVPISTSALLYSEGALYGTTSQAGSGNSCPGEGTPGCGVLFKLTLKTGVETVLHSFRSSDGTQPTGGLINVSEVLYGTTAFGGGGSGCNGWGCGTIFSYAPSTNSFISL
jgi:uncharacterized repeat protein (TIGR03803 family)